MLEETNKLIEEKAFELALKHARIIESEVKKIIEKYNCKPEDIILEQHGINNVIIKIRVAHIRITDNFTCDDKRVSNIQIETETL